MGAFQKNKEDNKLELETVLNEIRQVELSQSDIEEIWRLSKKEYKHFIDLYKKLPLKIQIALFQLFRNGNYPKFLKEDPFFLMLITDSEGNRIVRMRSKGESFHLSFDIIQEKSEADFLRRLLLNVNYKLKNSSNINIY